jgi:hypothetical protein
MNVIWQLKHAEVIKYLSSQEVSINQLLDTVLFPHEKQHFYQKSFHVNYCCLLTSHVLVTLITS